jgi:hypothetical protein
MTRKHLAALAALAAVAACDSTDPRVPASIQIEEQALNLEVGETVQLVPTILDRRGVAFTTWPEGLVLTWSSSDQQVAAVSDGEVLARGPGEAVIRATSPGLQEAEVEVRVEVRVVTAELAFDYEGHRDGSFEVAETWQLNETDWVRGTWAITFYDSGYRSQDIVAQRLRADGLLDFIWFWMDSRVTATGTRNVDDGFMLVGLDLSTEGVQDVYDISGGQVVFTDVNTRTLEGTFEIVLAEWDSFAELTIKAGSFDIPLVTEEDVSAASVAGEASVRGTPGGPPGRVLDRDRLRSLRETLDRR